MTSAEIDYAAEMKLPEGKTCDDCKHAKRCFGMGFAKPGQTYCDFYPRSSYSPDLKADNERLREERDELAHQLKVAMGETSLRDESIKTLVLFFAEDAERQEFVELVKEAKPGMIERTIPSYPTKSDAALEGE